jgi:DNA-binding beta-propeller fold protein YncE
MGAVALVASSAVGGSFAHAGPARAAATAHDVEVPVGSGRHIVVVAGDGSRVFVADFDSLIVTDAEGSVLGARHDLRGIGSVAVSPDGTLVYVVQAAAVQALDAETLDEVAVLSLPERSCARDLTPVGGRLWMLLGCDRGDSLASVDLGLAGTAVVAATAEELGRLGAAGPTADRLYVTAFDATAYGGPPGLGSVVAEFALDGSTASVTDVLALDTGGPVVVSPDGRTVFASGRHSTVLDVEPLRVRHELEVGVALDHDDWPEAWAISPDGRHLVGARLDEYNDWEERYLVWSLDHPSPIAGGIYGNQVNFGYFGGVAFGPDGTLYGGRGTGRLHITSLPLDRPRMELDAPNSTDLFEPVRIVGQLWVEGGAPASLRPVSVVRRSSHGSVLLAPALTGPDGAFSVVDTPLLPGDYTYRVADLLGASSGVALASVTVGAPLEVPVVPVPPLVGLPDLRVPVAGTPAEVSLVDDERRRVFVVSGRVPTPRQPLHGSEPAVEVFDFAGVALGTLALAGRPSAMAMSDDGTHLYVTIADRGEVAVFDAASLAPVGVWPTAPLVSYPTDVVVAGGRVWVSGPRDPGQLQHVSFDPARPLDLRVDEVGLDVQLVDDRGHEDRMYIRPTFSQWGHRRVDATTDPPSTVSSFEAIPVSYSSPGMITSDRSGQRVLVNGYRDYDVQSMARLRTLRTEGEVGGIEAAATGPIPGTYFVAYHGLLTELNDASIGVYTPLSDEPLRTYEHFAFVDGLGASADGSVLFATVAGARVPDWPFHRRELLILRDPLAACRVELDLTPDLTATAGGLVRGILRGPSGTPAPGSVTVSVGGAQVMVQAGADGRFAASLASLVPGPARLVLDASMGNFADCRAVTDLLIRPDQPLRPTPVTDVVVDAVHSGAVVRWNPPAWDGGTAITGYTVRVARGPRTVATVEVPPNQTDTRVTGLANAVSHTVVVTARNAAGTSTAPPPMEVVPSDLWPFASASELVAHLYRHVLGREPDGGAAMWIAGLDARAVTAPQVIDVFLRSAEFTPPAAAVVRLHLVALGRFPTGDELRTHLATLRSGGTPSEVAAAILASPEFLSSDAARDSRRYVDLLYDRVTKRSPSTAEATFLARLIDLGYLTRPALLDAFAASTSYVTSTRSLTSIVTTYLGMLDRAPEFDQWWGWWLRQLSGTPTGSLVEELQSSADFGLRVAASP